MAVMIGEGMLGKKGGRFKSKTSQLIILPHKTRRGVEEKKESGKSRQKLFGTLRAPGLAEWGGNICGNLGGLSGLVTDYSGHPTVASQGQDWGMPKKVKGSK